MDEIQTLADQAGIDFPSIATDLHQFIGEQAKKAKQRAATQDTRKEQQLGDAKASRVRAQSKRSLIEEAESESNRELRAALHERHESIVRELSSIPPSVEKALTYLEVGLLERAEASPDSLSIFGPDERHRFRPVANQLREELFSGRHWSPPVHLHEEWSSALLRYYEDFEPNDAKAFIREVAVTAVADATYGSTLLANATEREAPPWELHRYLYSCWLYSRSRTWRYLFGHTAARVKHIVLSWQKPNGAWIDYVPRPHDGPPGLAESASTTAYAMHFLARYGTDERDHRAIDNAVRWLLRSAEPEGGWRGVRVRSEKPEIVATIAVLDALRRGGAPLDHPAVRQGEEALLRWQDPTGSWIVEGVWDDFTTSLGVEYFRNRTQRGQLPNGYLHSARKLLMKSEELFITDDATNGNLALVAAYHGLEHFLYGALLHVDDNSKISADDGKTIGFREALTQFRGLARQKGWVAANSGLPHETQLRELAASRDLLVHRGQDSAPKDVEQRLAAARRFVLNFDLRVLGFRLLD